MFVTDLAGGSLLLVVKMPNTESAAEIDVEFEEDDTRLIINDLGGLLV